MYTYTYIVGTSILALFTFSVLRGEFEYLVKVQRHEDLVAAHMGFEMALWELENNIFQWRFTPINFVRDAMGNLQWLEEFLQIPQSDINIPSRVTRLLNFYDRLMSQAPKRPEELDDYYFELLSQNEKEKVLKDIEGYEQKKVPITLFISEMIQQRGMFPTTFQAR